MSKLPSITIADISITLDAERLKLPAAYLPFASSNHPDIRLALLTGPDDPAIGVKTFDSPPIWSLYRSSEGFFFRIYDSYPHLRRTLFIPDEGGRARLSFHAPDHDPFVGPAFELLMITHLARRDGVTLHGCGISTDGRGVVFAGESGAGKSTLSRLWAQREGIEILSDDRVIVRRQKGSFYLYGTPWHGEAAFAAPGGVELRRIFFIRHGQAHAIRKLSPAGAVREMLKCSFPPLWDAGGMAAALELFHGMATSVPCAELAFVPDSSAIDFVMP
ncbi:MAG TPA: hypothetical protein VLR50_04560 [Desulfobacterales bacterium]|nr:hypothetical protein [Desulfobacterales bacterium]